MTPRSYLFVPGDRPERFEKAAASGADIVVLDLEDAVVPAAKAAARDAVQRWLVALPAERRQRTAIRINDLTAPAAAADLSLLATASPGMVMLPKAESAADIAVLRRAAPELPVIALIETARGVAAVETIAAAPGVSQLAFGTIDFALDLGIAPEPAGLLHAAGRLVIAARAAGLPGPVAGVTPQFDDDAALLADLAWARALGFAAKLCIHPRQIAPLHAALRPSAEELDEARRIVAAADAAGGAAVQLDGRMVDRPIVLRARALLARAAD